MTVCTQPNLFVFFKPKRNKIQTDVINVLLAFIHSGNTSSAFMENTGH